MIEEHNVKANRTFTMGLNKWSDLTPTEFQILMMKKAHLGDRKKSSLLRVEDLPMEVDWRKKGCVSPVEDQGGKILPMGDMKRFLAGGGGV